MTRVGIIAKSHLRAATPHLADIATWLANTHGLQYVGYYLTAAAGLTLLGLLATRETKGTDLAGSQ